MIAKGGNLDAVLFSDLEDELSFFPLNVFAIEFESDHNTIPSDIYLS